MKKLSDYKDEEALDLWADLFDSIVAITSDEEVKKLKGKPPIEIAKGILKLHRSEVVAILLRIDPAPIDGLNIVIRFLDVLMEVESSPEISAFLGLSEPETMSDGSSGSATENIKGDAK